MPDTGAVDSTAMDAPGTPIVTVNRPRPLATVDLAVRIAQHRNLLGEMMRRELQERYAGQALSWFWLAAQPVLLTFAYVVIFGLVFRPAAGQSPVGQIAFMLAGLLPWIAATDVLGRASFAIHGLPGFVKQMVFPIEVLVLRLLAPFVVSWAISTAVYLVYLTARGHGPSAMWLLAPVPLALFAGLILGMAFAAAAIGVFLRDIREAIQLYLSIGLFVSPILYDLDAVPRVLAALAWVNPITPAILVFQDVYVHQSFAHPWAWLMAGVVALGALEGGFRVFRALRPAMGDAL